MKKTLVIGASNKNERYSNIAVRLLRKYNHQVKAFGLRKGNISDVEIFTKKTHISDIHTITIYVNPNRQTELYKYIFSLKPKRIIFNPGTENIEFKKLALTKNIEVIEHCTLILLRTGDF